MQGGHALAFGIEGNFLYARIRLFKTRVIRVGFGGGYQHSAFGGVAYDAESLLHLGGAGGFQG